MLVLAGAAPATATTPDRLFQPAGAWSTAARAATYLARAWPVSLEDPWLDFLHPATAVGEAKDGRLLYPVPMTPSPGIYLRNPNESWTTSEVIVALRAAAQRVREELPGGFDLVLGDFSLRKGGRFPPHSTHQNGLDVDLRYYQTGIEPGDYRYHFISEANFDTPRVWALLTALIEMDALDRAFMDVRHQRRLYRYATGELGLNPDDLRPVLSYPHGRARKDALVVHVRGHHNHLHLRFRAPLARLMGSFYSQDDALVVQRAQDLDEFERFEHVVRRGDTLGAIAAQHDVDLDDLRRWNRLGKRSVLRPGKVLVVRRETQDRVSRIP